MIVSNEIISKVEHHFINISVDDVGNLTIKALGDGDGEMYLNREHVKDLLEFLQTYKHLFYK